MPIENRIPKNRYNGSGTNTESRKAQQTAGTADRKPETLKKIEAEMDKRAADIAIIVSDMFKFMAMTAAMLPNMELDTGLFRLNTNASGPSEEIARLAGVRFVNISEPEKKITFNAALVKRMTGNDTLNARFLHENSFDFRPNFKIFINTNYKPSVSDMTLFYSCRLKLIPFKRHFEEHEQDKGLKAFFATPESQSAIFNWCYAGYKLFRKQGLDDPAAVTEATKEYQDESDRIGQFVDAWLEEGEAFEERTSAVYRLYGQWCDKYGYRKENSTNFNNAIQRFFPIIRKRPNDGSGSQTTMLVGCRFLKHENGELDHAATEDDDAALS